VGVRGSRNKAYGQNSTHGERMISRAASFGGTDGVEEKKVRLGRDAGAGETACHLTKKESPESRPVGGDS